MSEDDCPGGSDRQVPSIPQRTRLILNSIVILALSVCGLAMIAYNGNQLALGNAGTQIYVGLGFGVLLVVLGVGDVVLVLMLRRRAKR